MPLPESQNHGVLDLRVGELVEIRSTEEILATLDETGALEGLPFMPEMLAFCGRRSRVFKRSDKTCDRIDKAGLRRMENAVHLGDLRCDGAAHGGCQAACLLFWKEAWLKRVDGDLLSSNTLVPSLVPGTSPSSLPGHEKLLELTTRNARKAEEPGTLHERYSCQATEMNRATSLLSPWDLRQYWLDIRSGNVTMRAVLRLFVTWVFSTLQNIPGTYRLIEAVRGPFKVPAFLGKLSKTPTEVLDLQPGETVEVKKMQEIEATLDIHNRNRGLSFDVEMVRFCGQRFKVRSRVDKIIDERTGTMIRLPRDCIILEGVYCMSDYHKLCPRAIYPYWREIWLRRVE